MTELLDPLSLAFHEGLLGKYSLERELGRGGMGVVYLARDVRLDRRVAIKLLPPEYAAQPTIRERFLREARTAARLSHPHIVPIHAVDEMGDFVCHVMTYVEGDTLAQRVTASGPLNPPRVIRLLREVGWALAYSHGQGVVHRDIKPANILMERETERAMVTDFGIARLAQAEGMTSVGELLGTPEYMSPEQAGGEAVDGRSDLYSLGIVGYFALTGQLPFSGAAHAVLAQQLTKVAPPLASVSPGSPRLLTEALDTCLAKDPAQRFASGEAFVDALSRTAEPRADIPPALRAFLDTRGNALIFSPVVCIPIALAMPIVAGESVFFLRDLPVTVGFVAPAAMFLARLRRLAREGFGVPDIATAIRHGFERRREELVFEHGHTESRNERVVRKVTAWLSVAGLMSILTMASLEFPMSIETNRLLYSIINPLFVVIAPLAGLGVLSIIPAVVSARTHRLRQGVEPRSAKFWDGGIGRVIMKLASWKLRGRHIPSDRPTEVAIAMSVESLFEALPKAARENLSDVPAIVQQLQARAEEARARIAVLDATAPQAEFQSKQSQAQAKAQALAVDVGAARQQAESRLAQVVTALDTIRLDLLRLQAGVGTPESVTTDLAAAQSVLDQVDRLVAATEEVERGLGAHERPAIPES